MEVFKEVVWTGVGEATTILTGIVAGEIFHRTFSTVASLWNPHEKAIRKVRKVQQKNRKRRITGNGAITKTPKSWFSIVQREIENHFDHEIFISAFWLLLFYAFVVGFAKYPLGALSAAIAWTTLRLVKWNQFISSRDLESLRQDEPHQFGEGLAWSYWCGLLKFFLHKNEDLAISEAIQEYAKMEGVEFETKDLLILIPDSCNFPDSIRSARIESLKEEVVIPVPFDLRRQIKRQKFFMKVYEVRNKSGFKTYNVIFDCPNILKTAMGPPDRPEEPLISDDLRRRNLRDFRTFLESNLCHAQNRATNKRIPVQFIPFDDTDWFDKDGNPSVDYPDHLADVIVSHFEGDLAEVISSDEYSD